jgi:hypothetical protein
LRNTVKQAPLKATGAHIGIIGHITIEEVQHALTGTEMANGFGNRFLWLCANLATTSGLFRTFGEARVHGLP